MYSWAAKIVRSRFFRFLISGGINTVATLGLYFALLQIMPYQASYTIAYLSGIVISYLLNRFFVFKTPRDARSIVLFPLVYVAQYCFGMLVLWLWVDQAGLGEAIGSCVVVVSSVPITYILTRALFVKKSQGNTFNVNG